MFGAILATLMPSISEVLDRVIPDKNKKAQVEAELKLKLMEQENRVTEILASEDAKQADIDLEDAKSESWVKSMWRPALCWVCVAGFAWACLIQPITLWYLALKHLTYTLPVFPDNVLSDMLWGLLGMGAYRTIQAHPTFKQ